MTIVSYQKIHTIAFAMPKHSGMIIPIISNVTELPLALTGQILSNNLFVNNLQAYAKIASLPQAIMPNFELEDSETDKLYKALDTEWNSPRKQLDLFISKSNEDWFHVGSLSLLNPSGYPYRTYNLQDLFTDSLAIELGNNGKIGVRIKDVGYDFLGDDDEVNIYGSAVQEFVINTTTENTTDLNKITSCSNNRKTITENTSIILESNNNRKYVIVQNVSNQNIFINFGEANANNSIKILPNGHHEFQTLLIPYYGEIQAVCLTGTSELIVMECI